MTLSSLRGLGVYSSTDKKLREKTESRHWNFLDVLSVQPATFRPTAIKVLFPFLVFPGWHLRPCRCSSFCVQTTEFAGIPFFLAFHIPKSHLQSLPNPSNINRGVVHVASLSIFKKQLRMNDRHFVIEQTQIGQR